MEIIAKLTAIIGLGCLIMTCSTMHNTSSTKSRAMDRSPSLMNEHPSIRFTQLKRVAPAFNAAGQPTVYILLGSEEGDLLDIYLLRSALNDSAAVPDHELDPTQVELRVQTRGSRFSQSNSYPPQVNVSIEWMTSDEVVINVSATLIHSLMGPPLKVAPSQITVRGHYLKELSTEI